MKRPLVFAIILVILGLIFVSPHYYTSTHRVKLEVKDLMETELHAKADFSDMTWYWLPFPHLVFRDTIITGPDFSINASSVGVYPDWLSILSGRPAISGIDLEDCHFILKRIEEGENQQTILPKKIRVTNGFFEIARGLKLPFLPFKDQRPYVKNLYGYISRSGNKLRMKLRGNTKQAASIELIGTADIKRLTYRLKGKINELDLSALNVKRITTARQFPTYGFVNVEFDLSGKGLEKSGGHIKVYSNCVISTAMARSAIFSCGSLSVKYGMERNDANITIENLDFERPRLHLKGTARIFKRGDTFWTRTDLSGHDIDIGEVRNALHALSIKDRDVQDFCTAIRGGIAKSITLHIDAPLSKWHSLSDMSIRGKASNVRIYVKDGNFFVDSVSGPFEIVKGVLFVRGARARLRKTTGTAGHLVLGLSKGCDQFKLDILISAPATDVKWALLKFTHSQRLHDELKRLVRLRGRLQGRLSIGDKKHDNNIRIRVNETRLSCFYKTLGMEIRVRGGAARYEAATLSLLDISGSFGPNSIDHLSGGVSWKNSTIDVHVNRAEGRMRAESLLGMCRKFGLAGDFIDRKEVDVSGPLGVNRLKFHVALNDPVSMTYLVSFSPLGITLKTNMLPASVFLQKGDIQVDNRKVTARHLRMRLGSDSFLFGAELSHKRFTKWEGLVKTSGLVRGTLWHWLEKNGLHLDEYTPRTPFYARDFKVIFLSHGGASFAGGLEWNKAGVKLKIKGTKEHRNLYLEQIQIEKAGRLCIIGFHRASLGRDLVSFSFRGKLDRAVLDAILRKNHILTGNAEGVFSAAFSSLNGRRTYRIKGNITLSGLHSIWAGIPGLTFKDLYISQKNGRARIKSHLTFSGDIIDLNGTIKTGQGEAICLLKLSAPKLSSDTFSLLQEFSDQGRIRATKREKQITKKETRKGKDEDNSLWDDMARGIRVKIDFNLQEVRYAVRDFSKKRTERPHELVLKHLRGEARIDKAVLRGLEAYSDDTCGLDLYLRKRNENSTVFSEFSAITPPGHHARFEKVLDCLGIQQDLITGPVTINLYLSGRNRVLRGNGSLKIKARNGYIHKFGLLSKIFSVVNIVDIFSLNKGLIEGTSPYERLLVEARITSGRVHMEKAYIKGPGINFYGTGDVYLDRKTLDLIIFIQPLKTVDKIITSIPIIGGIIGGKNKSLFAIPVKVSGDWSDPQVDMLPAKTVTDIFKKLIFNVLTAPLSLKR